MIQSWTLSRIQRRREQKPRISLDGETENETKTPPRYGYRCSMCLSYDLFNEEGLFYNPPIDILRRSLTRLFTDQPSQDDIPKKRQAHVSHPLPCATKIRHRHGAKCHDVNPERCTITSHWQMCPGFYSVTLVVRFTIIGLLREGEEKRINYFRDIELVEVASACKVSDSLGRGYSTLPWSRNSSAGATYQQVTERLPQPLSLSDLEDMWLNLSDAIFHTDIAYFKLCHFNYQTDAASRLSIAQSGRISPQPTTLVGDSRRSALAYRHQGIPLSCSLEGGKPPETTTSHRISERLLLPTRQVLEYLSAGSNAHLYFNSCHVCKGRFGADEFHVTLALVAEAKEEEDLLCKNGMLSIHVKQNPLVQIDTDSGTVKVMESLEKDKRRFWIDIFIFDHLELNKFDGKWQSIHQV